MRPNFKGPSLRHLGGEIMTAYEFSQMLKKTVSFVGLDIKTSSRIL